MSAKLGVISKGNKFVVTKDGEPIHLPKSNGQTIVTEFDTREDAEKYISILNNISKQSKYAK
jgi:hypothetical protein